MKLEIRLIIVSLLAGSIITAMVMDMFDLTINHILPVVIVISLIYTVCAYKELKKEMKNEN